MHFGVKMCKEITIFVEQSYKQQCVNSFYSF